MRPPAPFSDLGFTPRQVRFVTLVALHSGYCLRRQYAAFAGVECGQNVRDFFDRLVALHLARQITFRRDRGHIYHLFARSIYAALEPPDARSPVVLAGAPAAEPQAASSRAARDTTGSDRAFIFLRMIPALTQVGSTLAP